MVVQIAYKKKAKSGVGSDPANLHALANMHPLLLLGLTPCVHTLTHHVTPYHPLTHHTSQPLYICCGLHLFFFVFLLSCFLTLNLYLGFVLFFLAVFFCSIFRSFCYGK